MTDFIAYSEEPLGYDDIVAYQSFDPPTDQIPVVSEAMVDAYLALPWWRRLAVDFGLVDPLTLVT
ncbi:hypothetical protein BI081_gp071 [Mycobacterium phage Tonenili]|uniref:Uncharacterized protein n=1 Tax=Mycobacterium phage Tonenili TaxID=1891703 RepID=A0A1C9EH54_9CAUD|nr:hypothetical protein BI081_gp071 [Mycobacterium phage Tonenili]AON96822.1 hypothetical protein SEA_TONENILI_71 [Mycobacterium phage Tonenili]